MLPPPPLQIYFGAPHFGLFKNLKFIYHLVKERGFTLEGAKIHLKEEKKQSLDNFEIINKLETVKNQLIKLKNNL